MKVTPLLTSLRKLQIGQHQHDVLAHQDILHLLIPKKLTHFTLHFAKYQGAIARALRSADQMALNRALVDSLIIALAAANAMNMNLQERANIIAGYKATTREELLIEYIEIVGNMAKACEVMDHLEEYPSRAVLERSVIELVILVDRFAQFEDFNIEKFVLERWSQVERKFFLRNESLEDSPPSNLSIVANG